MTGYIYTRQGFGLVRHRLEDARERRRQQGSPLLLIGAVFAGLCLAARVLKTVWGGG